MLSKKAHKLTKYIFSRCSIPPDDDLRMHIQMRIWKALSESYQIGRADHADGIDVIVNMDGFVSHLKD